MGQKTFQWVFYRFLQVKKVTFSLKWSPQQQLLAYLDIMYKIFRFLHDVLALQLSAFQMVLATVTFRPSTIEQGRRQAIYHYGPCHKALQCFFLRLTLVKPI